MINRFNGQKFMIFMSLYIISVLLDNPPNERTTRCLSLVSSYFMYDNNLDSFHKFIHKQFIFKLLNFKLFMYQVILLCKLEILK